MAKIFRPQKASRQQFEQTLEIADLSLDGDGIGFIDRKPVSVAGTIPGESVQVRVTTQGKRDKQASLIRVIEASGTSPYSAMSACRQLRRM